ncbi:MAG: AmmeMemoRadiSam system protein B, partial [Candidatus Aenigmarchaeota archaeon]|nr:AmmeMemoRadiSam system protein B [Candidatus Aenigmarchaeota archaeon]MDW8149330.1 AmmeMemoRadiSam system protein B [Candidatus Aenigmarchaeota archaeon]
MLIREAAVAGSFYSLDKENLLKQIEKCFFKHDYSPKAISSEKFKVCIVPHAGYEYSGPVAAHVYSRIGKANYIIIGPNHYGRGSKYSVYKKGIWKTPLGEIVVDEEIADNLIKENSLLEFDVLAHEMEHSIEVQLPFLQFRFGSDFKIVPISIMNEFPSDELLKECKSIALTIASIMKDKNYILIASTDLSHYLTYEECVEKDKKALDAIKKLNERLFFETLRKENINMCGF